MRKILAVAILICQILKSLASSGDLVEKSLQCSTPTHTGECIALKECPILYNMVMNYSQLAERDKRFIKDSQCGYNKAAPDVGSQISVCCPTERALVSSVNEMLIENVGIDNSHCGWIKKREGFSTESNEVEPMPSNSGNEFPWMALIEYVDVRDETRRGLNCSGTLINNRYILTAAHCVNNMHWKPYRILLGHWDQNSDIECLTHARNKADCSPSNLALAVEVDKIIVHPNYPFELYHDIALIRMKEHVDYTHYIRPICLPFTHNLKTQNFTNILAEFASWGQASKTGEVRASGIFKIPLRIWNTNECRQRYRIMKRDINLRYELCAGGEQNEDTCNGDSGGALMYSVDSGNMKVYYVVGVMVAGTVPCALQGWPNINIDVQSHLQWILYQLTE